MLSIGKMSLACHVSIKTLRYYDRIGLLRPAMIDADSGYRYYAPEQIETMVEITRYKRFGFSLQEIQTILQTDPLQRRRLFEKQMQSLYQTLMETQMALQDLRVVWERTGQKETEQKMNAYTIDLTETCEQPILSIRRRMGLGEFGEIYGLLFEKMHKMGTGPCGPAGARYFDQEFDDRNSDIEVFFPVDAEHANSMVGGGLCVHTVHHGGYSTLNEGYAQIVRWMEENGYEMIHAPYEI